MRGQENLIAMRLKGKAMAVSIGTDKDQSLYLPANWKSLGTSHAFVAIDPDEKLRDLDLRFLVSLRVHVEGCDDARVVEVFEAAKQAGALRVIGTVFKRQGEEYRTVRMLDTEGLMEWPE